MKRFAATGSEPFFAGAAVASYGDRSAKNVSDPVAVADPFR